MRLLRQVSASTSSHQLTHRLLRQVSASTHQDAQQSSVDTSLVCVCVGGRGGGGGGALESVQLVTMHHSQVCRVSGYMSSIMWQNVQRILIPYRALFPVRSY